MQRGLDLPAAQGCRDHGLLSSEQCSDLFLPLQGHARSWLVPARAAFYRSPLRTELHLRLLWEVDAGRALC